MRVLVLLTALSTPASASTTWSIIESPERFRSPPWRQALDNTVQEQKRRFQGNFALYVSDMRRGYRYRFNAERPFYLASGVKLAFMLEVFRQREAGKLGFDDLLEYGEAEIRDGAPRVNTLPLGSKVSIADLLDYMMRSSDNSATDMLARKVGLETVNRGLLEEGLLGFSRLTYMIDVRRGVYREVDVRADDFSPPDVRTLRWTPVWDPQVEKLNAMLGVPPRTYSKEDLLEAYDRFYATGVNRAPMNSIGLMFELMLTGRLVSKKASLEMLELLTGARTSTARLLGQLPEGTVVAHKTGSQWQHLCDMGVIKLPDATPLVVAACTEGGEVPPSEALVARLARKAYDLVVSDHAKSSTHP